MSAFELGLPASTPYDWTVAHDAYPQLLSDGWHVRCGTCSATVGPYTCRAEAVMDAASHIRAQWPAHKRRPS